jgi:NitT/TauT family transport system ATP-binding protein
VSVIRAFLSRPSALLMDEPFAALDYQTRLVLHRELLEMWGVERPTVVFVTHDIDEAVLLSDRILVLSAQPGKVIDDFAVTIPRPRNALTTAEPGFCELKARVLTKLGLSEMV